MLLYNIFLAANQSTYIMLRVILCKLVLAFAVWPAWASEPAKVVTSIKPLALIARDLLGELASVETLLPGTASPHDYALRVSDLQRLEQAHLVIWLGPDLERFLVRPLARLPQARVVALAADKEGHAPGEPHVDPHGWLDPAEALDYAGRMAERFMALYPARRDEVEARLANLAADYRALDETIAALLEPVRERGFVVYHRGYDYYVARYGLNQVGWVTMTPEQAPGARHLYELEQGLARANARCLFTDTAHPAARAETLAARLNLRTQSLDLAGAEPAVTSYRELMLGLTRDLRTCLFSADAVGS